MAIRQDQLEHVVEFIKSKGPFPKGEVVMLAGNFNTDALIGSDSKRGSTIADMLKDPVKFPLVAERKADVLSQYQDLLEILADGGSFKVFDALFEKEKLHKPTYDVCRVRHGEWVPTEIFYTDAASECSNQALDYIFHLDPQGVHSTVLDKKKKVTTKVDYTKSEQQKLKTYWYSPYRHLSTHYGVSATVQF